MAQRKPNKYQLIIERVFLSRFRPRIRSFEFRREELEDAATELSVKVPKNLGDIVYSFRYRSEFPQAIQDRTPPNEDWIILPAGKAKYRFTLTKLANIHPTPGLSQTKVPDSTPGVVSKYKLSDEQALLARLRYNRLIDIFLRLSCYSLQNHLRTSVEDMGQIETDEIYVGIERRGAHYVIPVQAKAGKDRISVVQVVQDLALCRERFPSLVCVPIAAQFMSEDEIALFSFEQSGDGPVISNEKHYKLVPHDQLSDSELDAYRKRSESES
jgi:hypothetical protein